MKNEHRFSISIVDWIYTYTEMYCHDDTGKYDWNILSKNSTSYESESKWSIHFKLGKKCNIFVKKKYSLTQLPEEAPKVNYRYNVKK